MADYRLTENFLEGKTMNLAKGSQKSRMDTLMSLYRQTDPFQSQEFIGHTGYVWGCAMTSDNEYLFSGSDDKLIKIWSRASGACVGDLIGHTDCAYYLIVTNDDKFLISAGWDKQIIIWDWQNRTIHHTINGHTNEVFFLLLTLDEKYLITGSRDMTVKVWDFQSYELVADFNYGNSVFSLAVTNNNKEIIATGFAETIKIFNFDTKQEIFCQNPKVGPLQCMALSPDNKYLAFGSRTGVLKVWNYSDKTEYCSFTSHENSLRGLFCTSDSNYLISSSLDKTCRIFSLVSKTEEVKLLGCSGWIYGLFLSKGQQFLLAGSTDKIMRIWKIGDKVRVKKITGHPQAVSSVAVTRDGKFIATTCADKIVRKWNREDGALVAEMHGHTDALWSITISHNMQFIASAGADKKVILWDFENCSLDTELIGHTNTIFALATTSDSKLLASASGDMKIILWDLASKSLLKVLDGHTDTIFALSFTYDNKELLSGAGDYTIRVWDMNDLGKSYKFETQTGMIESIALNKDETILALGSRDKTVHLWDWKLKKPFKKLSGYHTNVIKTVKFFQESNILMSASLDFTVHIWDADEERHDSVLKGHTFAVRCADITGDGNYIVSVGNDLTIRIWDLKNIGELEVVDIEGPLDSFLYLTKIKKKISPSQMNYKTLFSPLKVNLAHIYAYLGYDELLAEALKLGTEIKIDADGNSPLKYALERRTQGCIDVILDYLAELREKDFPTFLNYSYAIRNEFEILLDNRSEFLPAFLEAIFFKVPDLTNFAVTKFPLPHLNFSPVKKLNPYDFVYHADEAPVDDIESPISFRTMPFPISSVKGSNMSIDLLDSISNCPNQKILRTDFVRIYVRNKWDSLWYYIFALTVLMWSNLALMSIMLLMQANDNTTSVFFITCFVAFIIVNALLIVYEMVQAFAEGLKYVTNVWNLVDISRIALCGLWLTMIFIGVEGEYVKYIAWPMAIVNFFRGLSAFRAFDSTRFYTRLILRAFSEAIPFLLVFFYSTLAFGVIYLAADFSGDYTLASIWSVPYELSMGNFDNNNDNVLMYSGFIIASIVNVIIILNLLISILGDSFESFQAEAIEIDTLEMVELVIELETLMSWNRELSEKMYFQTCEDLVGEGNKEWEGRLKAVFTMIESVKTESTERFDALERKIDQLLAKK